LEGEKEKFMTVDAEILQTIAQMPEALKQELLHYAKYLLENYSKEAEKKTPKRGGLGIWQRQNLDCR
jgi:hypothetical protein